ncbi:hypothetical protein MKZ38_008826 [Zalerion maritima]|uniref:Grh/CP2 DB domain-containing protein n=1 Tax=Zalerion maritima TaxID=339359 RepID=A0AAD5RTV7_9PEZI|nr:hypothetical protein MKZ38_008826 [Zalerion maritima]
MFRSRTSSAKPGDDLLANFRQQFPEVTTVGTAATTGAAAAPAKAVVHASVPSIVATSQEGRASQLQGAIVMPCALHYELLVLMRRLRMRTEMPEHVTTGWFGLVERRRSGGMPRGGRKPRAIWPIAALSLTIATNAPALGHCHEQTLELTSASHFHSTSPGHKTQTLNHEAFKDQDPTPRATNDQWRFTPSLLDPNSFSFASFASQPPGYYTPTPGGTNTIYHPQAGDLHTPTLGLGMGIGLNTPLSLPTSEAGIHHHHPPPPGGIVDMPNFHSMAPHQFQFNPFAQPPVSQPSFAPTSFVHQDTGYETMEQDGSPMDSDPADERIATIDSTFHPPPPGFHPHSQFVPIGHLPPLAEKFRFHSTLNAPTAMIRHADEIPVTYLNKGQAYSLSVVDTASATGAPIVPGTQYRTYIRVSFEDDQQRQKPGVCWSLWKEGRGTNEAHQRGGKLQAVEFVEAGQPAEGDDKRTRIELESASFDGFSVVWTPGINGAAEVNVAVRFNFLSTDFSHSKGVKGIPVRLCSKTSPVLSSPSQSSDEAPEICYCKVKLFRDHGAERKLSNDVAHVKKTIDKLKQQIAQAESGMKDFGKRKRGTKGGSDEQRPGKVQKHKRTWSMSSASSAGGTRMPVEDDMHIKLQSLQDMFTSTRPISILYLRGEDLDDPDAHPVSLPGEPLDLTKVDRDNPAWQARSSRSSIAGSSMVSPSPSSLSLPSQVSVAGQPWREASRQSSADQPTKVEKHDDTGSLSGWIEALDVDPSYRPPPERAAKPVACFYVAKRTRTDQRDFHKAVYLMERSANEFANRVAIKWQLDPAKVQRTIHVLPRGLEVEMDDEVIQALPEGQDMILDIRKVSSKAAVQPKADWEMVVDVEPNISASNSASPLGYELRLKF